MEALDSLAALAVHVALPASRAGVGRRGRTQLQHGLGCGLCCGRAAAQQRCLSLKLLPGLLQLGLLRCCLAPRAGQAALARLQVLLQRPLRLAAAGGAA